MSTQRNSVVRTDPESASITDLWDEVEWLDTQLAESIPIKDYKRLYDAAKAVTDMGLRWAREVQGINKLIGTIEDLREVLEGEALGKEGK
jgi:hypothetical protein